MLEAIYKQLENINYGYLYDGEDISEDSEKFSKYYRLLDPVDVLNLKYGVCWDQVELERLLLTDFKFPNKSYFIYLNDHDKLPSHTFIVVECNNKYIWFEHAWSKYKGMHEYNSLNELFDDVIDKFIEFNNDVKYDELLLFEYDKPKSYITCNEFYDFINTQKLLLEKKGD